MDVTAPPDIAPMEARLVETLPDGPDWAFEPKWDGFRCLAFRDGGEVALWSKSGKPLDRYFPDIVAALRTVPSSRFLLDGELVIAEGEGLSFSALQARLHPAESRIRKLVAQQPAQFILFDCLALDGRDLAGCAFSERRAALEALHARIDSPAIRLSPLTPDRARAGQWLAGSGNALDGVVAKRLDLTYRPGDRAMAKIKRHRTADCVVGGFRYAGTSDDHVGSLLLGLYGEDGKLDHVGFTSSFDAAEKAALRDLVVPLIEAPGFTGDAPGGPSRWATARTSDWRPVRPVLVVEVRYDQVTAGRFRHGATFLRWRPDKAPRQCGKEQLARPLKPAQYETLLATSDR